MHFYVCLCIFMFVYVFLCLFVSVTVPQKPSCCFSSPTRRKTLCGPDHLWSHTCRTQGGFRMQDSWQCLSPWAPWYQVAEVWKQRNQDDHQLKMRHVTPQVGGQRDVWCHLPWKREGQHSGIRLDLGHVCYSVWNMVQIGSHQIASRPRGLY